MGTKPFPGYNIRLEKSKIGINTELLHQIGHAPVDYGAYYMVTKYQNKPFSHRLWLCPVTEFVFEGSYPSKIYLKKIR